MGESAGHPFRGNQYKPGTAGPRTMRGSAIHKELDAIDAASSAHASAMIAAGRGHETPAETRKKSDPLAQRYRDIEDRRAALHAEVQARAGAGYYRLPHGVGASPREKADPTGGFTPARQVEPRESEGGPHLRGNLTRPRK